MKPGRNLIKEGGILKGLIHEVLVWMAEKLSREEFMDYVGRQE